jgi:hypothetical protein
MTRAAEIEFEMIIEHDPDSHPKEYLFQNTCYFEQDEARLNAWRNDEWRFIGVRAKATLKIPYGANPECWITSEVLSPGLWGIESDSDDEYFQQIYQEERTILIDILDGLKSLPPTA